MRRSADEIGATSISFRPKVFSDPASAKFCIILLNTQCEEAPMKSAQLRFHFGRKCLAIRHRLLTEFFPCKTRKQPRSRLLRACALREENAKRVISACRNNQELRNDGHCHPAPVTTIEQLKNSSWHYWHNVGKKVGRTSALPVRKKLGRFNISGGSRRDVQVVWRDTSR